MEDCVLDFKMELLSLEELAANTFASRLWELPDIKQEVNQFLYKYYNFKRKGNAKKYLNKMSLEISNIVVELLNRCSLPEVVKIKIRKKIWDLAERMFDWIMYLTSYLDLDIKYAEKIYWTSTGLVDVDKIFKSYWMNFPVEERHSEKNWLYAKFDLLSVLACLFAQEDYVINHQADITKEIISAVQSWRKVDVDFDVTLDAPNIMSFVIHSFRKCKIGYSYIEIGLYHENQSKLKILDVCKDCCLHKAFFYFWSYKDPSTQCKYLEQISAQGLRTHCCPIYGREHLFQIVFFLMGKASSENDRFIFEEFNFIFFNFLKREPLQKFCIPLASQFISLNKDVLYRFPQFLEFFFSELTNMAKISNDYLHGHIEILEYIMQRISASDTKINKWYLFSNVLDEVMDTFSIPVLKLLYNDADLMKNRLLFFKFGEEKYRDLIENNNFELLNQFLDEVLMGDEEKRKFKEDFNFLEEWVGRGQYDVVDNVLNWMHGDQAHVYKIQLKRLCCSEVPRTYVAVNKLLKWYTETEKEPLIENCKDKSILKEFSRELIYNMWFRSSFINLKDRTPASKISSKILSYVFGCKEEISSFKTNELVSDDSCVKLFCDNLLKTSNKREVEADFSLVDEFFNFCSLPKEKVEGVKKLIADNIDDWVQIYGACMWRYDIVAPLLDWVFGDTSNNCKILQRNFKKPREVGLYYRNRRLLNCKKLRKPRL